MRLNKQFQIFTLFFILFAIFTKTQVISWGDASRMATIQSLVDYHTFSIDRSIFSWTGDKYLYNNHFYSDKPQLLSLYGAVYYFALKNIFNISFVNHQRLAFYLITLLTIGAFSAFGLVYFYKTIREIFQIDEHWASLITLITGTGTLILPYSVIFNNHNISAFLLLISFYYLLKDKRFSDIALSGFLVSLAGNVELNCFFFIPFAVIYFVISKSLKAGIVFSLACVPLIAVFFGLNYYTSNSIIPPAMNQALWIYPGSSFTQQNLSGLAKHENILGALNYAFHMLLGNRGLISHTPLLIVSFIASVIIFKNKTFPYKKEYLYISTASLAFVLIYIARTVNYSGYSFGIRWFATIMPLLCLPIAHIRQEIKSSKLFNNLFIVITCISILFSLIGTYNPFPPDHLNDAQRYANPPNTLLLSLNLIATESSLSYKVSLLISTLAIYFILFRILKKLPQKPI
jgi:hypothetical protein